MNRFDVTALPPSPWKNGSGTTRTIAISPPGADFETFDWRISIAEVASAARFSPFPGVDRTILLLDGAGLILQIDGRVVPLTTLFEPYKFSGDEAVRYRLVNGSTRDFNVMTRRGRAEAEVQIWRSEFQSPVTADAAVFYCARGACRIDAAQLDRGWALCVDRPGPEIQFAPQTPDAVLIAVLITNVFMP
jgi:environmental stress-induced protein Ves